MEHVKLHAKEAHDMEKIPPEAEKKIRENIKSVALKSSKK